MSWHAPQRTSLLVPLLLAALAACQDATSPRPALQPNVQFAQGDNDTWTVTSLADPGDGVCDDTECTLREAIAAAASGGSIVFASGLQGTIQLTGGGAGQLAIQYRTVSIDGDGRITIDAQGNSRVLYVSGVGGATTGVSLTGLTLTNGSAAFDLGGGIYVVGASLTLDRVTVSNNEAEDGGGIYVGGAAPAATVTIRNSTISSNTATSRGGGMYVANGASVTLVNTSVQGNGAVDGAGGIHNFGTLGVVTSTLSDNESGNGGGVYNAAGATAELARTTISGNRATSDQVFGSGGIYNLGTLALRSATVTRNSAVGSFSGGGLRNVGPATFMNTIITGNTGTSGAVDNCVVETGSPNITSLGYNLVTGCFANAATDVQVTQAQAFTEVLEQELKDNGGPTGTHALIARGLAVDAGYCPGETADQRGFARPVDDPLMPDALDGCDIGAYEIQGPVAAVADLMISQSVDKLDARQGEQVTYTVRVQNLGPQTAPNVAVNDALSSGVTFVEARSSRGSFTAPPAGETGTVTWSLGDMQAGDNEVAEIAVTVIVRGKTTVTNTATVTGDVADPNEANNSAAITVSVGAGGGSGGKGGGPKK